MDIPNNFVHIEGMNPSVLDVDLSEALRLKSINPDFADPTFSIVGADLTLYSDYDGGPTKDETIGTAGVIDMSAGAYDTIQELCAYVNAQGTNWRLTATGSLPADSLASSELLAIAADADAPRKVGDEDGASLFWDSSVALKMTHCLGVEQQVSTDLIPLFLTRRSDPSVRHGILDAFDFKDEDGTVVPGAVDRSAREFAYVVNQIIESVTGTGGTDTSHVYVYSVRGYTRSTLIWDRAGGATTVSTTFDRDAGLPVLSRKGERIVIVVTTGFTALTAQSLSVSGQIGYLEC